jgi:hypothetical protein
MPRKFKSHQVFYSFFRGIDEMEIRGRSNLHPGLGTEVKAVGFIKVYRHNVRFIV